MVDEKRCSICGEGVLQHLGTEEAGEMQDASSSIIETYSCGHEVTEAALATADADRLEVERRSSEETVEEPLEEPGPA
jgi:hypothetical protein